MIYPDWISEFVEVAPSITHEHLSRYPMPKSGGGDAAVLILLAPSAVGDDKLGDVLLIQRAGHMRTHAGQPAFPGGKVEDSDTSRIETALREAAEETGLRSETVEVIAQWPELWLEPSQFRVTPIVAWWREPHELRAEIDDEVMAVHRIPIRTLINPQTRVSVRHPSGFIGPGFEVNGMLVWGFTGGLLSHIFDIAGWAVDWDSSNIVDLASRETSSENAEQIP